MNINNNNEWYKICVCVLILILGSILVYRRNSLRLKKHNYAQSGIYFVMPNHFHGVIIINDQHVGASPCGRPSLIKPNLFQNSSIKVSLHLGEVVGRFKSITTHRYINGVKKYQWKPFYEKL